MFEELAESLAGMGVSPQDVSPIGQLVQKPTGKSKVVYGYVSKMLHRTTHDCTVQFTDGKDSILLAIHGLVIRQVPIICQKGTGLILHNLTLMPPTAASFANSPAAIVCGNNILKIFRYDNSQPASQQQQYSQQQYQSKHPARQDAREMPPPPPPSSSAWLQSQQAVHRQQPVAPQNPAIHSSVAPQSSFTTPKMSTSQQQQHQHQQQPVVQSAAECHAGGEEAFDAYELPTDDVEMDGLY